MEMGLRESRKADDNLNVNNKSYLFSIRSIDIMRFLKCVRTWKGQQTKNNAPMAWMPLRNQGGKCYDSTA